MNSSLYHELVDAQWMLIEEGIDESGADIDYDRIENVLTLDFADSSQIIITRQEAMSEIWMASKSGGFHFRYIGEQWKCSRSGTLLSEMVKHECSIHTGTKVDW